MSGRRIFIALDISDAVRAVCSDHIDILRRAFPQASVGWERLEKLHITLEFLGPVDAAPLQSLQERLSDIASRQTRFNLNLSSTGVFPSRSRSRILWIGIDDEHRAVDGLYEEMRAVCSSLGYQGDGKSFKPHITIGRVREPGGSSDVVTRHLQMQIKPVRFEVSGIVIYESQLQPTGSVYSIVSRSRLS